MHRSANDNGWLKHGGYMQAKKTKLEKQFAEKNSTSSKIFRNICIYVNGYTNPPASTLRDLIHQHGGTYKAYYSRSTVTHTIVSRLPHSKIKKLTDQKFVIADWIVQSIQAGKLLPWQRFQLCAIRHGGPDQKTLGIKSANRQTEGVLPDVTSQSTDFGATEDKTITKISPSSSSVEHSPIVKHRAVKQLRLDTCRSPAKSVKPSTSNAHAPNGASTSSKLHGVVSLKQLLAGGSKPSGSGVKEQTSDDKAKISPTTTTTDEQLATFYARSRLHHLSSWANELGDLVRQLRTNPQHSCDLGLKWRQSMLNQAMADGKTGLVRLKARLGAQGMIEEPARPKLSMIFHIDMDCFFVSVTLRNRPELKDKPVAITHAQGNMRTRSHADSHDAHSMSEVASCSYAARKAGVRNGMLLGRARQLCPDLITLPYDFEAYNTVSKLLYNTVGRFTKDIEAVSCDELYADCTQLLTWKSPNPTESNLQRQDSTWLYHETLLDPLQLGHQIRSMVEHVTGGCTASIGFGTTKLLARLATKKAKPNGQTWFVGLSGSQLVDLSATKKSRAGCWTWYRLETDQETGLVAGDTRSSECELQGPDRLWLEQLAVLELPGIGRVICDRLRQAFGVVNCKDLMDRVSKSQLIELLGTKTGNRIYWLCRARDSDTLCFNKECKSVSASMNYGIRLKNAIELESLVRSLCQELSSRMANATVGNSTGCLGRSLTIRLFIRLPGAPIEPSKFMGHGACSINNHTIQLPEPTSDVDTLYRYAIGAVKRLCHEPSDLRGKPIDWNFMGKGMDIIVGTDAGSASFIGGSAYYEPNTPCDNLLLLQLD